METFDAASYLTEKLRTLHPESYEEELDRTRRNARRQGIVLGAFLSLGALLLAVGMMFYFTPDLAATLVAGIQ